MACHDTIPFPFLSTSAEIIFVRLDMALFSIFLITLIKPEHYLLNICENMHAWNERKKVYVNTYARLFPLSHFETRKIAALFFFVAFVRQ